MSCGICDVYPGLAARGFDTLHARRCHSPGRLPHRHVLTCTLISHADIHKQAKRLTQESPLRYFAPPNDPFVSGRRPSCSRVRVCLDCPLLHPAPARHQHNAGGAAQMMRLTQKKQSGGNSGGMPLRRSAWRALSRPPHPRCLARALNQVASIQDTLLERPDRTHHHRCL